MKTKEKTQTTTTSQEWDMKMEHKYAPLEKISIAETIEGKEDIFWFNQTLCKVNGSILRIGVFEGEFPMHTHDEDDEVFFVLEGSIVIETPEKSYTLNAQEGLCVPKGVMHRPIAKEKAVVLMVENDGINPFGNRE